MQSDASLLKHLISMHHAKLVINHITKLGDRYKKNVGKQIKNVSILSGLLFLYFPDVYLPTRSPLKREG